MTLPPIYVADEGGVVPGVPIEAFVAVIEPLIGIAVWLLAITTG